MIALIQRVTSAAVEVEGAEIAAIGKGVLALIGVERGDGEVLFVKFVEQAAAAVHVAIGRFGAEMKVSLVNDGPVTFWLQVRPRA